MINSEIPTSLEGIIKRLKEVYPLKGFRGCKDLRELDRYQGAQDVIDHLENMAKALEIDKK